MTEASVLKEKLISFLEKENYDYLIVNSTNEFLAEYNELEQNARYYLTGFAGSTGDVLLSKSGQVHLFVDGRYHKQADNQSFDFVNVVKMGLGESFLSNLIQKIAPDTRLAIVANKTSLSFYNGLKTALNELNVKITPLNFDPVFEIVEKKPYKNAPIIDIPNEIAGKSSEEKIITVQKTLKTDEIRLVTNLEQIAWLLNKRSFAGNFSSSFKAKMVIEKDNYKVFFSDETDKYKNYLQSTEKTVFYAPKSLSLGDYLIIQNKSKALETDQIENSKAIKNNSELKHMQSCFERTDKVVSAVSNYVNSAEKLTEQELVTFVKEQFLAQEALDLSFNTILASGKNSALAHYSTDMDTITEIQKGDFVLLDCGGYFEGGYATDITRVFCFGDPSDEAKKVYTTVLKANLNAYHTPVCENLSGFDIDKTARRIINENLGDTYNFNHSTGHGVGIGVHEFPPSVSPSELGKTPLKDGMVFTIEPGAYNPDFGGVRLENTVYLKDGRIQSFAKMRFEEKLIDYSLLNKQEIKWLKDWQEQTK